MNVKYWGNKARRSFWLVHIEAWQRSGMSRTEYCRVHRLVADTMAGWQTVLESQKAVVIRPPSVGRKRRRGRGEPLSHAKRSIAVQAFWAMHVEAMNWCSLSIRDYARAHHLSESSLKLWRKRLETGEVQIEWRERLHPSALARLSTSAKGVKENGAQNRLTARPDASAPRDGRANRRHFTDEQKLAIVLECEKPGVSVSAVARAHALATSAIFRWRADLGYGRKEKVKFALAQLDGGLPDGATADVSGALMLHDLLPIPDGMEAVELAGGRRVYAPIGSGRDAVERHVEMQEVAR